MNDTRRWTWILVGCSIFIALLLQVPQLLHQLHPSSEGVMVHLNSDESVYLARVQESLSGRPERTAEAFTGDDHITSLQAAAIERWYGHLFRFTGWSAATVLQIMDSVVPALIFLVLWGLFVAFGFTKKQSLFGALLFVGVLLYLLNRPVQQRTSFLLGITAILGIVHGARGRLWIGIAAAVLLGQLLDVYFWSWTYAWAWCGLFGILSVKSDKPTVCRLSFFVIVCLISALPHVWLLFAQGGDPLFEVVKFRTGIPQTRLPESVFYSGCFVLMLLGVLGAGFRDSSRPRTWLFALVTVLTSVVVLHQQLVHGMQLRFVSHYLFFLVCSAVVVLLFSSTTKREHRMWSYVSFCGAFLYLLAVTVDGVPSLQRQFTVSERRFTEQHFSSALPVLHSLSRATILTDDATSLFVAGHTHHDVLFATYMANSLLSNEELAERRCLVMLPEPPQYRDISEQRYLLYPGAVRMLKDPRIREREVRLVRETCDRMDADPASRIRAFGITYILWDEERQPRWELQRIGLPLENVVQGRGWSLWKIQQ